MMNTPPSPTELLTRLSTLARRRQDGEPLRPHVVSLLLRSGRTLRGTLIDARESVVALELESGALALTALADLEGVILESPADAFRPPDDRPALSNSALRKLAEDIGCAIERAESADERCALADTLEQLGVALTMLQEDPDSAATLEGITLAIALGDKPLIARDGDHIQITRSHLWTERLRADTLLDALEDVL